MLREHMRWYCPICQRRDPRHPLTKPEEMPSIHNRPESMGNAYSNYTCKGKRIAQVFNLETREWVNI